MPIKIQVKLQHLDKFPKFNKFTKNNYFKFGKTSKLIRFAKINILVIKQIKLIISQKSIFHTQFKNKFTKNTFTSFYINFGQIVSK